MTLDELMTLLDQVELACGEEIAGPLRRAVRERDGALGMLGDDMPIEALRAVAEWAGEHPDIQVELVRFGGEFPTVNLRRTGGDWRQRAMRAWSSEEFRQAVSIRDLIRDDLDSALRQIERRERASEPGRFPPGIESATVTFGGVTVPVQSLTYSPEPLADDAESRVEVRGTIEIDPEDVAAMEAEFRRRGMIPCDLPGEFIPDPARECKVCGATPDADGWVEHGRGCYRIDPDGGGSEFVG